MDKKNLRNVVIRALSAVENHNGAVGNKLAGRPYKKEYIFSDKGTEFIYLAGEANIILEMMDAALEEEKECKPMDLEVDENGKL